MIMKKESFETPAVEVITFVEDNILTESIPGGGGGGIILPDDEDM